MLRAGTAALRASRVLSRAGLSAGPRARTYAADAAAAPAGLVGKLTLNFSVPHQVFANETVVKQVNLVSTDGEMGILADHVPTVAQLKPGLVEIFSDDAAKSEKFFVSGGFAVVNDNSTLNINAVEAVALDQIDFDAARRAAEDAARRVASAATEAEKASAAVELEVYEALAYAATKQ